MKIVAYLIQLKGIYFNKGLLRQPLIEVKVGFNMNIGDLIFQLVFLIFIFGIFSGVFFLVLSLVTNQPSKSESIEQKLIE
ncbi:hypothetical protein CMV16_26300 [Peribacillus simplex]|nr:hypothetical protein CMV16_26300 [Peribacillus simplex]